MNNNHKYLEDNCEDDVYSFSYGIFKVGKIREAMNEVVKRFLQKPVNEEFKYKEVEIQTGYYNYKSRSQTEMQWFGDGVDCELLSIGSNGWKKGKMRIRVIVEFCPDESTTPESPLDDIRQREDFKQL